MTLIAVFTTVGSLDEARAMARTLVQRKLAACAQISEIESFYPWQGSIHNDKEFRIVFKTTGAQYAALETAIRELHPYELPAIHALAVEHAYAPYAAWVEENSTGG